MNKYVFIDTGEYIKLFNSSASDVEQVKKFSEYMEKMDVTFVTTSQVQNEYIKNRSHAIKEVLEKARVELSGELPLLMGSLEEKSKYKNAVKEIKGIISEASRKVENKAKAHNLGLDKTIDGIFQKSEFIPIEDELVSRAHDRFLRGLPPRKNKKDNLIGDAVNWEALKTKADFFDDLIIISGDGDFASFIDPKSPHEILIKEWHENLGDSISLYKSLTSFLKQEVDDEYFISLDSDRLQAVEMLYGSSTFASTHSAIESLKPFNHFDLKECEMIVGALSKNNQVNWISGDSDVSSFYKNFYTHNVEGLSLDQIKILKSEYPSLD